MDNGVRAFWQESSFAADAGRMKAMQAMHRDRTVEGLKKDEVDDEAWRNCVKWCAFTTGNPRSPFYSNEEDREVLFSAPVLTYEQRQMQPLATPSSSSSLAQAHYVFFIQGTSEEPFPPEEVLIPPLKEVERNLVEGGWEQRDLLAERLILIDRASHFAYFTPEKKGGSLETAMRWIEETIEKWSEREIVRRYQVSKQRNIHASTADLVQANQMSSVRADSTSFSASFSLASLRIHPRL